MIEKQSALRQVLTTVCRLFACRPGMSPRLTGHSFGDFPFRPGYGKAAS